MAWYWWILVGLCWSLFWATAVATFIIATESIYPIIAELRETQRTKSILDKIPTPIFWLIISLLGPLTLGYFWVKIRNTLIKKLKKN